MNNSPDLSPSVSPVVAFVSAALAATILLAVSALRGINPGILFPPLATLILLPLAFFTASSVIGMGAFFQALRGGVSLDALPDRLRAILADLRVIDQAIIVSGGTMVLLGLIAMLARSSEPAMIGPAVAFALQTSVFTIVLSRLGIYPLVLRVRRALGWPPISGPERLLANLAWIIFPLATLLGFLLVLFTLKGGS